MSPDDAVVAEAHALDDLAVADVEAGDDAFGKNGRNSSDVIRSSSSALPLIAAATPMRVQRGEVRRIAHAAGGLPRELREARAARRAYSATFGPASAPSRSMSVHSTCCRPAARTAPAASHRRQRRCLRSSRACARAARRRRRRARRARGRCAPAPKLLEPAGDIAGSLDGGAADHDARDAVAPAGPRSTAARAHAAADLDAARRSARRAPR